MADEDDTLSSSFDELTVDSSASPIEAMERTAAKLKDLDLKPVDVIADFLSDIREVTLQTMARTYDEDFVAHTEVEYVLTIPAIWSDQAKHAMIQAAEIAGLGTHRINFHLISEPEAAAVYTMRAIQPHELRVSKPRHRYLDMQLTWYRLDNRSSFVMLEEELAYVFLGIQSRITTRSNSGYLFPKRRHYSETLDPRASVATSDDIPSSSIHLSFRNNSIYTI